ncbi:hypothetical protein Aduo_006964 [Ancylostoma duodenale]
MVNATASLVPREMNADELVDMLGNGTADISIFALIQKKERMEKVDFTTPIGFIYTGYFIREIAQIEVADYIMTSFRIPAFSILLLTSLTVAMLLFFYTKVFGSCQHSLSRWLMITFEGLLKQFELDLRGPICVRILACAWLWFCFTIIVHYEAKLRSVLTLTRYRGTIFTNLDEAMDAMEYHGWKMIIQRGGYSPFWYCRPVQCARLQKLQKRGMVEEHFADVDSLLSQERQFVFSALAYDLAPNSKSLVDDRRRLLFIRDDLITPKYLAFAVRKGMPNLLKELNEAIALTFNSFETIRGRYQKPYDEYVDIQSLQQQMSLSLPHFHVLLDVALRAYLVALSVLVGEIIYFRHGQLLLDRINEACRKFFFTAPFPSEHNEESFELASLSVATEESSQTGAVVRRRSRRSLIKELQVSLLIPVLATRDHHFVFGALPKDLAPHRKSLVDDTNRILFVRDELITPMYLAFAVRKGMPELLEKLNQAIAIMSNSFNTIRGRYQNPYEKYADKQFYKRQTALTMAHFQVVFHFGWKCFLVAFILFVGEIFYHRHGQLIRDHINAVHQKLLYIKSLRSMEINGFELSQRNVEVGKYTKTVRNGNGTEFNTLRKDVVLHRQFTVEVARM